MKLKDIYKKIDSLNEAVNMSISMSGETADDVATLMKMVKDAGGKPEIIPPMPKMSPRDDIEKSLKVMDLPPAPKKMPMDMEPGCEVFNNYGPKGNEELLLNYGFAYPENENNKVQLKITAQKQFKSAKEEKRQKKIHTAIVSALKMIQFCEKPRFRSRLINKDFTQSTFVVRGESLEFPRLSFGPFQTSAPGDCVPAYARTT